MGGLRLVCETPGSTLGSLARIAQPRIITRVPQLPNKPLWICPVACEHRRSVPRDGAIAEPEVGLKILVLAQAASGTGNARYIITQRPRFDHCAASELTSGGCIKHTLEAYRKWLNFPIVSTKYLLI
jgi:hypothetical protein